MHDLPLHKRWPNLVKSSIVIGHMHLKRRYCNSLLGAAWSWMHPLMYLVLLWLVFSNLMPRFDNYFVYLASGLMPWTFLRQGILSCTNVLIEKRHIFYSTPTSYKLLIFGTITAELMHFSIAFMVLLSFILLSGGPFGWHMAGIFIFLLNLILFTYAWGTILAYLTPMFRDITHLLQMAFTFGFWMTPIVYHWSSLPSPFLYFVKYNPITLLISPFQILLHGGIWPSASLAISSFILVGASVCLAWWLTMRSSWRQRIIYYL